MSRHVMSCCVASDETWGREGVNLFARGGVLFKPGGHSVRLHLRTEAILPSQLFTVTRSRCYLLAYPTICVLHSVFKLSGHPSPSFIFCFPASLCGVHVLASVSRRCRLLLHRLSLLTHSFAHLTFSSFTHSLTHSPGAPSTRASASACSSLVVGACAWSPRVRGASRVAGAALAANAWCSE